MRRGWWFLVHPSASFSFSFLFWVVGSVGAAAVPFVCTNGVCHFRLRLFLSFVLFCFVLVVVRCSSCCYIPTQQQTRICLHTQQQQTRSSFIEFCFFAHQRNFPYFRSCGKREKGAIMTVMAEPDSATVDIKPEVSTQYPSSSSSASSLFSHLCIQSINQIVSGGRSRSSEI